MRWDRKSSNYRSKPDSKLKPMILGVIHDGPHRTQNTEFIKHACSHMVKIIAQYVKEIMHYI